MIRILTVLLILTGSARAESASWIGLSLDAAVARIAGDRVIYNSDQRLDQLFVRKEPDGPDEHAQLQSLLAPHGLTVRPGPGQRWVVVRGAVARTGWNALSGSVVNAADEGPVDAAVVAIYPGRKSVYSNTDGAFVAEAGEQGPYTIIVSAPGYVPWRTDLDVLPGNLAVELVPLRVTLDPLTVTVSHYALLQNQAEGSFSLDRGQVEKLPHISDDVLRAVRWLPGIAWGDFSAQMRVRGGQSRETQVIFDGLRLHEPYHLKDLLSIFSVVDSNTIDAVDFYSGPLPARYGNASSAVLDIQSRTPGTDWDHRLGISFLNAYAQTSGATDNASWLASVRTGYLDIVLDIIDDESGLDPTYSDFFARYDYALSDNVSVQARVLAAVDHSMAIDDDEVPDIVDGDFEDYYAWLSLNWFPNLDWTATTDVFWGSLGRERLGEHNETNEVGRLFEDRSFDHWGLRQSLSGTLGESDRHQLDAGIEWQQQQLDQIYQSTLIIRHPIFDDRDEVRDIALAIDESVLAVDAALTSRWRDDLQTQVGARFEERAYLRRDASSLSPRLSVLWRPAERAALRLGFGRHYQAREMYELDVQDGFVEFETPQRVDQLALSYEYRTNDGLDLRAEAYHKDYDNPLPYTELVFDSQDYLPELQGERVRVDPDRARAYGVELSVRRNRPEGVSWWAGYVWSRTEERVDEEWIQRSFDQPHAFNLGVSFPWKGWDWTFGWRYHTGWRQTPVRRTELTGPTGELITDLVVGQRNSERLAPYHRLDLRASRAIPLRSSSLQLYFEIINLYDRKNECCVGVFGFLDSAGQEQVFTETEEWLPLTPSVGVRWEF